MHLSCLTNIRRAGFLSVHSSLLLLCVLAMVAGCKEDPMDYPNPVVERPPLIGLPFVAGTFFPLSNFNYKQKEFFFSGTANAYVEAIPLTEDGQWSVIPAASADYKSRMLVYLPKDPADFNGTVLVEWLNVTAGVDTAADWVMLHTEILRRGYAWVGISAQAIGIEGGEAPLPTPLPFGLSLDLKSFAPNRYGSLSHPGDSFSYDIFAQAAQAIRYPTTLSPLGQLPVQRMIAVGQSQSATRLLTFANAFGTKTDLFDGYFIHSRLGSIPDFGGASAPLSQPPQADINAPPVVIVREDLTKPVMNIQTESDFFVLNAVGSRQPDNPFYRLWEITGASHADLYTSSTGLTDQGDVSAAEVLETYSPSPFLTSCPEPINTAPQHHFVAKAALAALNNWLINDTPPPSAPRWQLNAAGDGFLYDSHGNVLGGVRSPYVDAPIALLSGESSSIVNDTDICFLFGATRIFDNATLASLYPDHAAYVVAVTDAANEAVAGGYLMPEDAQLVIDAAQAAHVPPL